MSRPRRTTGLGRVAVYSSLLAAAAVAKKSPSQHRASLGPVEQVLLTTANEDFDGDDALGAAMDWHRERLLQNPARKAPYLACAEYGKGRQMLLKLERLLSKESLRGVSNHKVHGTCFIATASSLTAAEVSDDLGEYGLSSFGHIPSALKLAPGLLDLQVNGEQQQQQQQQQQQRQQRLATTHGKRMRFDSVGGLDVALSPGILPAHDASAGPFIADLREGLLSGSMDLHSNNFWSDPVMVGGDESGHLARPAGALRAREWKRAADVVGELSTESGPSPGDICSWGDLIIHHAGTDTLRITGMGHLLHLGRGAGGTEGAEADELQMACLMGLVSFLMAVPEVQRIAPLHLPQLKNAVAAAVIQSGNIADKPLTDLGLDGTGEVIQIVDSGLDETSCFFIDDDGEEVEHGYYFDEIGFAGEPSTSTAVVAFSGGYFPFDADRRKVIQYIRLVKPDTEPSSLGPGFPTTGGGTISWYSASGFGEDLEDGHGTHTAGSAAGATINTPAMTGTCLLGADLGCVGGCFSTAGAAALMADGELTWDTLCPQYDCDGFGEPCLGEDVSETLTDNGGVARGAKISVFDSSIDGELIWASLALTGLWDATEETGCVLHSSSWGGDSDCNVDSETVLYDDYMYKNPEHLLIFAAGNEGDPEDKSRTSCTINIPGIGKNALSVGASSSGPTRRPFTAEDGGIIASYSDDLSGIDTVAYFSSYGLTNDGRIKPDVVAPGDQVLSASSDGEDTYSCKLAALSGTSMATPIVAGAAAMVRQYFKNETFYAEDVNLRGLCASLANTNSTNAFACEAFSPSAATVKAMLINSAHLMGGSSEPDGFRGFGRVHLEAGVPIGGEGDMGLFVADSFEHELEEYTIAEYKFEMIPDTGLELRATLTWIDPAAAVDASTQLLNDLDLTVVAPDGMTLYRMFADGADDRNVVERVIVSSGDLAEYSGTWTVAVSCFSLTTADQPFSLVVTGPIDEGSGAKSTRETSGAMGKRGPSFAALFVTTVAMLVAILS